MRRLVVAMMVAGAVQAAHAADMPDYYALRGPVGYGTGVVNWQGFYAGGQAGYGSTDMNFSGSNDALIHRALGPDNILLNSALSLSQAPSKTNTHQTAFGGFVGYNSQWDDVVIGVEANYMHGKFNGVSGVTVPPGTYVNPFSDGRYHTVELASLRSVSITDMGTVRARAGYAMGSFLPYVFGGVALGRANITSAVAITDRSDPDIDQSASAFPVTTYGASDSIGGKMLYGYTAGIGTEAMLFGNVFARAEWEYVRFVNAGADVNINTVRGGLGYIEEWINPRLIRDAQIGLLWEGTSNINGLDVITRAVAKERAQGALRDALHGKLQSGAVPTALRTRIGDTVDRAIALAEKVGGDPRLEDHARRASSALYHAMSAALLAWEGAELGARGGDARRLLLARLVLEHRIGGGDPLALPEPGVAEEITDLLLDDAPVPLERAAALAAA